MTHKSIEQQHACGPAGLIYKYKFDLASALWTSVYAHSFVYVVDRGVISRVFLHTYSWAEAGTCVQLILIL